MKTMMLFLQNGTIGPLIITEEQAQNAVTTWREGTEIGFNDGSKDVYINTRGVVAITVADYNGKANDQQLWPDRENM